MFAIRRAYGQGITEPGRYRAGSWQLLLAEERCDFMGGVAQAGNSSECTSAGGADMYGFCCNIYLEERLVFSTRSPIWPYTNCVVPGASQSKEKLEAQRAQHDQRLKRRRLDHATACKYRDSLDRLDQALGTSSDDSVDILVGEVVSQLNAERWGAPAIPRAMQHLEAMLKQRPQAAQHVGFVSLLFSLAHKAGFHLAAAEIGERAIQLVPLGEAGDENAQRLHVMLCESLLQGKKEHQTPGSFERALRLLDRVLQQRPTPWLSMRARDLLRQVMDTYGYFLPEDDPLMSLLRRHVWVRYGDNAAAVPISRSVA